MRATRGPGASLLQHSQPRGFPATQARGAQQLTGRQRRRYGNAPVDADRAAITRTGDRVGDMGERNMPTACPIPGDPVGRDPRGHRARQPEPHPAHLGHPHPTKPAVQTLDVVWFDRDLPESLVHTGFTPRRAAMRPGDEAPHGLREVPQRLLLHGLGTGCQPIVLGAGRGQLGALLVVAGRVASRLPVLLLLDGQVPHIPGVAAMLGQRRHLLESRKQPVSRHPDNVTIATDKLPKREAAFPRPAKARGFHAAGTQ